MLKKWVSVFVVLVLAVSVLSGCGPGSGNDNGETAPDSTSASTSPGAPKEEITIKIGSEGAMNVDNDELGKFIQDKLKINFEYVSINATKLNLLAVTDDLPDFFVAGAVGDGTYTSLKEEEYIRDIPEAILADFPYTKKMVEDNEITMAYKQLSGGKLWNFPRPGNVDKPEKTMLHAFAIRWDWAQNVGITKVPETLDEFYELLKRFRENDPDQNGKKDTYALNGNIWSVHYIPWFDETNWVKEDGRWIPGYMSRDVIPALKWWNKLVKDDIMPADFASASGNGEIDDFVTNVTGCLRLNASDYHLWDKLVLRWGGTHQDYLKQQNKTVQDCIKILPPLKKDANTPARWTPSREAGCVLISSEVDDKKLRRILEFYEFTLSPEGQDLTHFGFLDKDYKIINGMAFPTLPQSDTKLGEQKKLWEKYPSITVFNIVGFDNGYNLKPSVALYPDWIMKLTEEIREKQLPCVVKSNVLVNNVVTPAKEKCPELSAWGTIEPDLMRIIAGDDVEGDFQKFLDKYMNIYKVKTVIEEVNKIVVEQKLDQ